MKLQRISPLVVLTVLLFGHSLASEPELVSEIATQGQAVHGDILDGKLILSSPESLQVLTAGGERAFEAALGTNQGLVFSDDGEFFGITTYSKAASPGFLAADKFELYSSSGNKLWEIHQPGVSGFFISPGARIVVGISGGEGVPQSEVDFYGANGNLVSTTKTRLPQGVGFSSDGERVLINSARDGLLLFERAGRLVGRLGPCDRFAVSAAGQYVAAASGNTIRLQEVGKPPKELKQASSPVRRLCFSPDSKYLGAIDKADLFLFEVETAKLLWQHSLEQPELSFVSLDLCVDGERIIAGLDFDNGRSVPAAERHTKGLVYLFDKQGGLIWQKEVSYNLWAAMFPLVKISGNGSRFSVATREKVYLYTNVAPQE
jgi:WD40 repeat protein